MSEENRQELLDLLAGLRSRAINCEAQATEREDTGRDATRVAGKAQAYDHAVILLEATLELMGVALETGP